MTMTLAGYVAQAEDRRRTAEQELQAANAAFGRWRTAVEALGGEGAADEKMLTRGDGIARRVQEAKNEIRRAEAALSEARKIAGEEDEYQRRSAQTYPTDAGRRGLPGYDQVHRIGSEPQVYRSPAERGVTRPGQDGPEPSFLHDLYMGQVRHDPAAMGRLERHGRQYEDENPGWSQHQRAIGTGAVSGFVPPQYLSDLFAEYARAGRPLANLCAPAPLPEQGMVFQIPRVTTPTATAVQAAEGGAIGNQDPDDTLLPVPVCTIGGYVDLSRQALERGVLVEQLVFGDLSADYNSKLDGQVINGSGSAGQHLGLLNVSGINAVTYTDATPTIPELWPKLADAVGRVVSGRFTGPTAIVMTPTAWAWILAERDNTGRPLVEPEQVAQNPIATSEPPDYARPAGVLFGVPVYLDGNVPGTLGGGTETRIIAADFRDCILFEDSNAPAQLRFEDVLSSTLQIRLLAYGYSGFAGGRHPKGSSVGSGTGLIVPSL